MMKRTGAILLAGLLLAACSTTTAPTEPAPSGQPSSVASASPSAEAVTAAPSYAVGTGAPAQLTNFRAHFLISFNSLQALFSSLGTDLAINNASAITTDVTAIQAWSKAESDWLASNSAAGCYGAAYTLWENVLTNVNKAATTALGGADTYDSVTANFALNSAKQVAALLNAAHC